MTVIVCIEHIVFKTQLVISQGTDMMGFNEPLLVVIFWDQLLDLLMVVLCRQVYLVASGDIVIQQLIVSLDHSKLGRRVEWLASLVNEQRLESIFFLNLFIDEGSMELLFFFF